MNARPVQPDGKVHGVAVAVRDERGRWLLVRRSATVAAPLKVCFPGGAVEIGESQHDAAVREMREELNAVVRPIRCVWRWDYSEANVLLFGWLAELCDGDIRPNPAEIAECFWLTLDEAISHPDALPTNRYFLEALAAS
jgi:8-oxo-dGTP diphosphatase